MGLWKTLKEGYKAFCAQVKEECDRIDEAKRQKLEMARAQEEAERKRQAELWLQEEVERQKQEENRRFAQELQQISHCMKVGKTHPDMSIRVANLGQAVGCIYSLLEACPHRDDWRKKYLSCRKIYSELRLEGLEAELNGLKNKINTLKTKASRISSANKALLLLEQAEEDSDVDYPPEVIADWRNFFTAFVHHAELADLLLKADKAEFKGEWKKAVSAYQDVLYFLKRDHIPDKEQAEQIAFVEEKIEEMQQRFAKSREKPGNSR